jgi:hypothetical protein
MGYLSRLQVYKESSRVSRLDGLLGYQFLRKVIVNIG